MSCVTRLSYNHKGDQSKSPWEKRVNSLVEEYWIKCLVQGNNAHTALLCIKLCIWFFSIINCVMFTSPDSLDTVLQLMTKHVPFDKSATQMNKLLIVKQTLLVRTTRTVQRTVWRLCITVITKTLVVKTTPVKKHIDIPLVCTEHFNGWIEKYCNLSYQFCTLVDFNDLVPFERQTYQ